MAASAAGMVRGDSDLCEVRCEVRVGLSERITLKEMYDSMVGNTEEIETLVEKVAKGGDKQEALSGSSQWEKGTMVIRSEESRSRLPGSHMTCSKFLKHLSRS